MLGHWQTSSVVKIRIVERNNRQSADAFLAAGHLQKYEPALAGTMPRRLLPPNFFFWILSARYDRLAENATHCLVSSTSKHS